MYLRAQYTVCEVFGQPLTAGPDKYRMRYLDIKPVPCACCLPALLEEAGGFGLQFNRSRFYANMRDLLASGITSDLEGVDTMVRLGYLEKAEGDEIFNRFNLEHPMAATVQRGSFNSARDDIRLAYDILFTDGSLGSGTSTLAHELRHRAFHAISVTPELDSQMPQELRDRWADGYGRYQLGVRRWQVRGAMASPEHAMIYAVQHRNIPEDRRVFFDNPALGGESVGYWRDLYTQVESAVSTWLQSRMTVAEPESEDPAQTGSSLRLSGEMQTFFTSLGRLQTGTLDRLQEIVSGLNGIRTVMLHDIWIPIQDVGGIPGDIVEAIDQYRFSEVPALINAFKNSEQYRLVPANVQSRLDDLLNRFESVGVSWRLLDPRTFSQAEFDALVRLRPDLVGAVPVVRVEAPQTTAPPRSSAAAATAPEPSSEVAPTVAPTGRSIGFYQFTASTRMHPNYAPTLWNTITGTNNLSGLQSAINGPVALRMDDAGLTFDSAAQAQLQALYRILQTDGYDSALVAQMLARIVLTKG